MVPLACTPFAFGQTAARGISIGTVMKTVLAESPDIEQSRLAIEAGAADRVAAASAFDFRMQTSVVGGRDNRDIAGALTSRRSLSAITSGTKIFRSGIALSTGLSLGRFASRSLPVSQADSSVSIRVPLAAGRSGGAAAGIERSAEHSYRAALLERGHVSAFAVLQAVAKYWQYAAALERLEIHQVSVGRAEVLVEVTEALIRADERPASDLDLMTSNLASKRTAVSASEQGVIDARYALGLAMGLEADRVQGLGPPLTAFPVHGERGPDLLPAALVRTATGARHDLAAAQARRDGARLAWEGALRDLRPRWDVVATVGHTSVSFGLDPAESLAPLTRGGTGLNSFVQIQYEPVAANSTARGLALRTETSYRSAALAADDLTRRIGATVRVAAAALDNAASEVAIAEEAIRLSRRSVATEEAKFRLGLATLFDAILSADALTSAQLRLTDARYRYAVALAHLRFETGTLLQLDSENISAETRRVLTFALEGESP